MCDGVKDDTVALQNAFNGLKSYQALQLPAGTCITSKQLMLSIKSNVFVAGAGKDSTILQAKDPLHSSVIVYASSNVVLSGFQVYSPNTTGMKRTSDPNSKGFFVSKSSGVILDGVKARTPAGAGVLLYHVQDSKVLNSEVMGSLADAFHVTGGSQNVLMQFNSTQGAGDDCFASIGYADGSNQNIQFMDNVCADNNGSAVSFEGTVGGLAYRNRGTRTAAAGIRVASQSNWKTGAVSNIDFQDNVLTSVKTGYVDHGAIMVFTSYGSIQNLKFTNTVIQQPNTWVGARLLNYVPGTATISGVSFTSTANVTSGMEKKCFAASTGVSGLTLASTNTYNSGPCNKL
jgi:hypothetical protein